MKRRILLSIIIPCYNSFFRLQNGLTKLEEQCDDEVEVIVVDDCSQDNSYNQLQEYVRRTSLNLRIYRNNVNSGPGVARNLGIEKALGEYITFLDSDDYFSDDYYYTIRPFLLKGIIDCLIYNFAYKVGDKLSEIPMIQCITDQDKICTKDAIVFTRACTAGKIYRHSIISYNNVRFLDCRRNEDMPFTKTSLAFCERIYYISKPLYYYVIHSESIMHNNSLIDTTNAKNAFEYIKNKIEKKYPLEVEALFIHEYLYSTCLTKLSSINRRNWSSYVEITEKKYPNYMHNEYMNRFPAYIRIIVKMIHYRLYFALKFLLLLKNMRTK